MTINDPTGKRGTEKLREIRILNLGAGHGSAPLVGMQLEGDLDYDVAIFSDTHDEPAWVYRQLAWLEKQVADRGGSPIIRVSAGDLMANLRSGLNADGGRFVSIPAFARLDNGEVVMTRRQCTREYKINPVTQYIRRTILGLEKGQRMPKNVKVVQLFGFSLDEPGRAASLRKQETKQWRFEFPLFNEAVAMRKGECRRYMTDWCREFSWHWSSCRACPFHSNIQWRELIENSPSNSPRLAGPITRSGNPDRSPTGLWIMRCSFTGHVSPYAMSTLQSHSQRCSDSYVMVGV